MQCKCGVLTGVNAFVPTGRRARYFHDMSDMVHVDEKWFYIHKVSSAYILARDEQPPLLACSNTRFIIKVMFLEEMQTQTL